MLSAYQEILRQDYKIVNINIFKAHFIKQKIILLQFMMWLAQNWWTDSERMIIMFGNFHNQLRMIIIKDVHEWGIQKNN